MKTKILAIWVILLLIAIPIGIAGASQTSTGNNRSVAVQLGSVTDEGIFDTETVLMNEAELIELENAFTDIIEKAKSVKGSNGLTDLIDNVLGGNNPIKYRISKSILKTKMSHSRVFIISFGRNYDFNPFKQNDLKIRKPFTMWHYSANTMIKGRTLIIRPLALMSSELISGRQFGIMTKFTGFYLHVSRTFPEQSYTFFIGTARHANGIELSISR